MATLNGRPLMSYRVVDLKEELEKRGLSKSGTKKDLAERLEQYILEHEIEDIGQAPSASADAANEEPPSVQIDTKLEENDIIKEYMAMRQSQFQEAMEGKQQQTTTVAPGPGADDDDEDVPLVRTRKESPKKRRNRGASGASASESEDSVKSPRPSRGLRSPLSEALSPPPMVQKEEKVQPLKHEDPKKVVEKDIKSPPKEPVEKVVEPVKEPEKAKPEPEKVKSPVKEPEKAKPPIKEPEKAKSPAKQPQKEEKSPIEELSKEPIEEPAKPAEEDEILVSENVTFDDKEKEVESNENSNEASSTSAPQVPVTFRKLQRPLSSTSESTQRKKRTWGEASAIDKQNNVSSSTLKDIIPDIAPVMEEIKNENEQQKLEEEETEKATPTAATAGAELPMPTISDPQVMQRELAPISEKNKNQARVVQIKNLVRPFTHSQLIGLLKRTGNFDESQDFWIDKIKSHALVKYADAGQAEETVLALDGVKWPSSNQKKLIVTFSSEDYFEQQSKEAVSLPKDGGGGSSGAVKRSAPEGTHPTQDNRKRPRRDSDNEAATGSCSSEKKSPKKEAKSLEVLFNKTKALPSIYWMPKAEPVSKADAAVDKETTTTTAAAS